jgi:membrane-associated phospholipid phosphatase
MRRRSTVVLAAWLCGCIAATSVRSEPPALSGEPAHRPYWRRNLFRRFFEDQRFLLGTWWPEESRRVGFSLPLGIAVAGAAGSAPGGLDLRWQRSLEGWTTGGRRDVAEGISRLGDSESAILLVGTAYFASRWAGNDRIARASSLSAEALMNTAVYTTLLKKVSRRERPVAAGTGAFFVARPEDGRSTDSFPSGHAAGAFAVAAVMSHEFRDRPWVPWTAYGAAGLVALSRVGLGRHFPSDVVAGAVLGRSLGRMVVRQSDGEAGSRPWTRFEPLVDPQNEGLGIAYRYEW